MAIVAAAALAAPLALGLFSRIRLPSIVLEIPLGIVIGPQVLGWVRIRSKAWRSRRPRPLLRQAVGLMPSCCRDNPGHVSGRSEPPLAASLKPRQLSSALPFQRGLIRDIA